MLEIKEILNKRIEKAEATPKSERAWIIKQLYELYTNPHERNLRKPTKERPNTIKENAMPFFCIKIAHIPTKDLYYLLSVGKDIQNRGGSFSAYLFWSIKCNEPMKSQ